MQRGDRDSRSRSVARQLLLNSRDGSGRRTPCSLRQRPERERPSRSARSAMFGPTSSPRDSIARSAGSCPKVRRVIHSDRDSPLDSFAAARRAAIARPGGGLAGSGTLPDGSRDGADAGLRRDRRRRPAGLLQRRRDVRQDRRALQAGAGLQRRVDRLAVRAAAGSLRTAVPRAGGLAHRRRPAGRRRLAVATASFPLNMR